MKKDIILPAMVGLGLFAESSELKLCNNTTILLMLFAIIEEYGAIAELKHRVNRLERHELCEHCSRCGDGRRCDDCHDDHFGRGGRMDDCHHGCRRRF